MWYVCDVLYVRVSCFVLRADSRRYINVCNCDIFSVVNAGVGDGWGVVSAGHVGGTRGSGIVSSAADVFWMSLVCGMSGVSGVCEMCIRLVRAAWVERV